MQDHSEERTEEATTRSSEGDLEPFHTSETSDTAQGSGAIGPRLRPKGVEFSIGMGILAPVACLALQPVLLGESMAIPGLQFLNASWVFSYTVIGLEIATLAIWLGLGASLGRWSGIVAGSLFAGGLFAGVIGLVLLPFSLIGMFILIGVLGFVPFFTSFVYFYQSVQAYRWAQARLGEGMALATACLAMVLVLGVPAVIQGRVSGEVRAAIEKVASGDAGAKATFRRWHRFVDPDRLVWAYASEGDPKRKTRLAEAFKDLTGKDVESRMAELND